MDFDKLRKNLKGDLYTDDLNRLIYATDGSAYREVPVAVVRPADKEDIKEIMKFARENGTSVIPRGAGTSLAGQVVGSGIVVDVSKYLKRIIGFNPEEKWIIVEPGVVLGELNNYLAPFGLMFGPETSTANRCCMGGMLGNNSCGLHSIIYGSVRDHILEAHVILSDGSEASFGYQTTNEFHDKCNGNPGSLETRIYKFINESLSDKSVQEEIWSNFPDRGIKRRNHGYAIDVLLDTDPFVSNGEKINICKLLAGSEGTLAFTISMKLELTELPAKYSGLLCAHFRSMHEALKANILALNYGPAAIELIDDFIVNCTKENAEQARNRFFIRGDPKAILIIEFLENELSSIKTKSDDLRNKLVKEGLGYHYPFFSGSSEIRKIWELRKAGLGVLLNIPGEKRSVQVIEDTSVLPERYPEYYSDFERVLKNYNVTCSYYGHIATGELHLSPLLNLRDTGDIMIYYKIAAEIAALVKKYRGSLSGEHGDGRLRGEFIPFMLGDRNYKLLNDLKHTWDPHNILNPGKITDTPSITDKLRYSEGLVPHTICTTFRYFGENGFLNAIEKCSGSGDCRKSQEMGGTMCPTFMATGDEDKSTRGRANILREYLSRSTRSNPFDHEEIVKVLDLCISCKACKSECPSNVDMASFKAEFLQHYYETHPIPFRSWLIAWLPRINKAGILVRPVSNMIMSTVLFNKVIGFAPERKAPSYSHVSLKGWMTRHKKDQKRQAGVKRVYLFADEFTNFNESEIGIKAIILLERLGYEVVIPHHLESGRTFISKGLLKTAKKLAIRNIESLKKIITDDSPLVGLEPSAILTFRDEYPAMLNGFLKDDAVSLAGKSMMFDEFICREFDRGLISREIFSDKRLKILLHGHCQQKSIASIMPTVKALSIPANYKVEEIASGCCGMAGAFGYEKEHYSLSMKIGELVLFPAVRAADSETIIAATGTSCRAQIADGTGRKAFHPAEILYDALKKDNNI